MWSPSFFGSVVVWHVEHFPLRVLASGYWALNAFWMSIVASTLVPTPSAVRRARTERVVFFINPP